MLFALTANLMVTTAALERGCGYARPGLAAGCRPEYDRGEEPCPFESRRFASLFAIGAGGAPTGWTTEFTGATGDARGTAQGRILYNEFLGDYAYAIGARTYGAGVWTDVPNTADCPAMDAWRQASFTAGHRVFPAPSPIGDCPANFGNSDISSATTAP